MRRPLDRRHLGASGFGAPTGGGESNSVHRVVNLAAGVAFTCLGAGLFVSRSRGYGLGSVGWGVAYLAVALALGLWAVREPHPNTAWGRIGLSIAIGVGILAVPFMSAMLLFWAVLACLAGAGFFLAARPVGKLQRLPVPYLLAVALLTAVAVAIFFHPSLVAWPLSKLLAIAGVVNGLSHALGALGRR